MKRKLWVALGVAVLVLAPNAVMAQSGGAVIERTTGEGLGYEWDGDHTLLIFSTMSNFFCGDDVAAPRDILWVTTPVGAIHYRDRGQFFARLYEGTPDELFAGDPFVDFICARPFWAEGILQSHWKDNDLTGTARGTNVWGHRFSGTLTDLGQTCGNGMVSVNFVAQWQLLVGWDSQFPACVDYTPSCIEVIVLKGPTVKCAN